MPRPASVSVSLRTYARTQLVRDLGHALAPQPHPGPRQCPAAVLVGHEFSDTELPEEVGQLPGHSQVMLAFPFVRVGIPVCASGELLVSQISEAASMFEQRLTVHVRVGVLLAEAASVLTYSVTFLLECFRADTSLTGGGDLIGARQEPTERGGAVEDAEPVVSLPLAVGVSERPVHPSRSVRRGLCPESGS